MTILHKIDLFVLFPQNCGVRDMLCETIDCFFAAHPELIANGCDAMPDEKQANPFLCSTEVNGRGCRTISERIVLLIVRTFPNMVENVVVTPHQAAKVLLPSEESIDMHRHQYFELFGVLDGQLEVRMEHATKRYLPGDFCLLNRNVYHSEVYSNNFSAVYLSLRPDYFQELMNGSDSRRYAAFTQFGNRNHEWMEDEDSLDFSVVQKDAAQQNIWQLECYLEAILRELLDRKTGYKDVVTGFLKRIFAHMQSPEKYICVNTRYQAAKDSVCHEILKYIHKKRRKISREELAAAMGYHCNYLADQFRKEMGVSLSSYIRDICIQEAAHQLLNTDRSVHEIIHSLGYENRTVFYQHFQEKYHMTPREYRQYLSDTRMRRIVNHK